MNMKDKSPLCLVSMVLLVVGGLNWGLTGLGMLLKSNLNVVNLLFGSWPTVEAVVYLLVGLAAVKVLVAKAMGKGCEGGSCE